jgi:hypothetical protein
MKLRPWLSDFPLLVVHDECWDSTKVLEGLDRPTHSHCTIPWNMRSELGREAQSSIAILHTIANHVRSAWCLYLHPSTVPVPGHPGISFDWFRRDGSGKEPVLLGHRWGYTKPVNALAELDDWGDTVPGLQCFPRLNLSPQDGEGCVRHAAIQAWCIFINVAWAQEILAYAPDRLPCEKLETYLAYCGARRGDCLLRLNLKQHGWHPVSRFRQFRSQCELLLSSCLS